MSHTAPTYYLFLGNLSVLKKDLFIFAGSIGKFIRRTYMF